MILEIVIFAMLAGFIALRLVHVLGRGPEDERARDTFTPRPGHSPRDASGDAAGDFGAASSGDVVVPFTGDPEVRATLQDVQKLDANFNHAQFLTGAKAAYEMVLEAFWAGDEDTLKDLTTDEVFDQFKAAISDRAEQKLTCENQLMALRSAEISSASLEGTTAEISVSFHAEVVVLMRNANGAIVEGGESEIVDVRDRWTFARNLGQSDPNWLLVETDRAED
ncbi:MAG: Tim44/TimA family putative adaptor protein [Pseudomonadota bacterium]